MLFDPFRQRIEIFEDHAGELRQVLNICRRRLRLIVGRFVPKRPNRVSPDENFARDLSLSTEAVDPLFERAAPSHIKVLNRKLQRTAIGHTRGVEMLPAAVFLSLEKHALDARRNMGGSGGFRGFRKDDGHRVTVIGHWHVRGTSQIANL